MKIQTHELATTRIAEIQAEELLIKTTEDGLDLLGNLYYQDVDKIILYEQHITPDFFDLKNGMAGEILQKFSNYRVRLAIVGDFTKYPGNSLRDFIYECNAGRQINFCITIDEALTKLYR